MDRPDPTIESLPSNRFKREKNTFVDSVFYGLAEFHPEDWFHGYPTFMGYILRTNFLREIKAIVRDN